MNRFFPLLILLLISMQTRAQNTPMSFRLASLSANESRQSQMVSILIKGNVNVLKEVVPNVGGKVKGSAGPLLSAIVPVSAIRILAAHPAVQRMEEGRLMLQELNDKMRINNKINQVHQGVSPLPQGYNGEGVVTGIIDTGIDFTHPDFKDSTGNTRILWIWDHLLPDSTNTPLPFAYGQEFSAADIDAGNAAAHIDQTAHGTHVAGIAASSGGSDTAFTGAAPGADIIAVSLDFNIGDELWLSSISDAVEYIFNKADSLNQPCVINISAGTYFGSHDGQDLNAQYIDNLITAKDGRMVVASAGNAGNYPLHVEHNPAGDTVFTWFRHYSSPAGIFIECWGDTAGMNSLQFALGADEQPAFIDRAQTNFTTLVANINILTNDTIWSYSGNRIAILQRFAQVIDGRFSMAYLIIPDSSTYYFRLITTGNAKTDCWSFDMIHTGLPTAAVYPQISKYSLPDFNQTICSSFQCSDKVITVGQYVNRNNYIDVNNNLVTFPTTEGALSASSSLGPTRDGRIKPDITSTGEVTMAALRLSSQAWFLANQPFKLAQGGMHIRDGGTSSSAPVVSGIIALYLQKVPNATWQDIRNRILLCSVQDAFTGVTPNNSWGHGKVDALAVMTGCNALSLEEEIRTESLRLYPNPVSSELHLNWEGNTLNDIRILNSLGQICGSWNNLHSPASIPTSSLPAGIYVLTTNGKTPVAKRFVKE